MVRRWQDDGRGPHHRSRHRVRARRHRSLHVLDAPVGEASHAWQVPDLRHGSRARDEGAAGAGRRDDRCRAPAAHRRTHRAGDQRSDALVVPCARAGGVRRGGADRREPQGPRLDHEAQRQPDRPTRDPRTDALHALQPRALQRAAGLPARDTKRIRVRCRLSHRGARRRRSTAPSLTRRVRRADRRHRQERDPRGEPRVRFTGERVRHREERRRGGVRRARNAALSHRCARQGLGRG